MLSKEASHLIITLISIIAITFIISLCSALYNNQTISKSNNQFLCREFCTQTHANINIHKFKSCYVDCLVELDKEE